MVTAFVMDNLSLVEKRVAVRLCFTQGYQKEKRKKEKRKKEEKSNACIHVPT
jgi:Zn ribbon nucleic-acid-binding protein